MLTPELKRTAMESFRLECDDTWGDALNHHFAVAEVLYHAQAPLPASWQFRDSPLHTDDAEYLGQTAEVGDWPDAEYVKFLDAGDLGVEMLTYAGNVLERYLNVLQRHGKGWE